MIKIVQINTTCNWGSHGRIAEAIGDLVIAEGWESYIGYGREELESSSVKIKIGGKLNYYTHEILSRLFDRQGFYSSCLTKKFINRLKEIKPNIIHLHNIHGSYINIKLLFNYIKKNNIPVVWTLHDCWSITGHCAHFESIGCEKWKSGCYSCELIKNYPKSLFVDNSRQNYRNKKRLFTSINNITIVPVSYWLGGVISESYLANFPVKVIQNGINLEKFQPTISNLREKYNLENKRIIIGVASFWSDRKGLSDFVKLSERLDDNSKIVLIGLSEEQIGNMPKTMIGIARTNSVNELAAWYTVADVFVNPTYEDTFPTTNLEALACGTPVITYNTGGSVESVDSETGVIVEKGDIDGLINAIDGVSSIDSDACVTRARNLYNQDSSFRKYIKLYKDILQKH